MTVDPSVKFSQKVPLGDETFTDGGTDYTLHPSLLGLERVDLAGRRVLDVATSDGFWTFWAEAQGSTDLLAFETDAVDLEPGGPSASVEGTTDHDPDRPRLTGFGELHRHFGSVARRGSGSVYELDPERHGKFDLVFGYGLLSRLRYPLLALDRIRGVCDGALVLETHVVTGFSQLPLSLFYGDDGLGPQADGIGPTEAMVGAWLRSAGFADVWVRRPSPGQGHGRAVFAASIADDWSECFDQAPGLDRFDDDYLADSRRQLGSIVDG